MLSQLSTLRDEHLVLIGFLTFFVTAAATILGIVFSVQWRKARQAEMELWFKHEMLSRGMSIDEVERLVGKKIPLPATDPKAAKSFEPAGFVDTANRAKDISVQFRRKLVRRLDEGYVGGLCSGVATHLGISPTIFRGAYVFAALCTGVFPLLIGYFIACCFIPSDQDMRTATA